MTQIVMDHGVSWCFGTKLAPIRGGTNIRGALAKRENSTVTVSARIETEDEPRQCT